MDGVEHQFDNRLEVSGAVDDPEVEAALALLAEGSASRFGVAPGRSVEVLLRIQGVLERLQALRVDAVAAVEAEQAWVADGAGSLSAWLRQVLDLPGSQAGALARQARALHRDLPATRAAWWAGELTASRVAALARTALVTGGRRAALDEPGAETDLVGAVARVHADDVARVLTHWAQAVDAAGVEAAEDRMYEQRRVTLAQTFGGTWQLEGLLDPVDGATLATALDALMAPRMRSPEEMRTVTQLRADALTDLARRSLDASDLPTTGGARPHLLVHLSPRGAVSAGGGRGAELDPGDAAISVRLAEFVGCDAQFTAIVTDSDGQVLDLGRTRRTVPTALRLAVSARDRRCVFPGCRRGAVTCDAHHATPWSRGGPTSEANVCLLCRYHHRLVHRLDLTVARNPDGPGWLFTHPDGSPWRGPPVRRLPVRRSRREPSGQVRTS